MVGRWKAFLMLQNLFIILDATGVFCITEVSSKNDDWPTAILIMD
jgi:hypothetical protein